MTDTHKDSPGEARTRQRQRRKFVYLGFALMVGVVLGFSTSFFDEGAGNIFAGDWDALSLPPVAAILIAVGFAFGLIVLPLWGFTQVDDFLREQSLIGYTGGTIGVIAGFPIWAALHAGGFTPAPHAFGIFAIGFVSMMVAFSYAKLRS